jgi:hypothetical protein
MAAFPLCGGIWATLVGFEYIGKPAGAELNPKYAIRRRVYRLGGPIVFVLGLWVALQPIVAPLQGVVWQRYAPAGAGFSIEMPGRPEESVIEETGEYGPVKNHVASVPNRFLKTTNTIAYYRFPKGLQPGSVAQQKELLMELVAKLAQKWEGELVDDANLIAPAGAGREFRFKLKEGFVYRGQLWFLGRTQFQLMVVGPGDLIDQGISRRFFDSFSYKAPPDAPHLSIDKDTDDSMNLDDSKDTESGDAQHNSIRNR